MYKRYSVAEKMAEARRSKIRTLKLKMPTAFEKTLFGAVFRFRPLKMGGAGGVLFRWAGFTVFGERGTGANSFHGRSVRRNPVKIDRVEREDALPWLSKIHRDRKYKYRI